MRPIKFPECNCTFGPPPDLEESQCATIHAYKGTQKGGSIDGSFMVVVAWKPNDLELEELNKGGAIYLTMLGGLAPHCLSTSFQKATNFK